MSAKTKKIDRDFVLSDSSVNVYNFRLMTSGYLIDEYLKNPIGYYNHLDDNGVLVRWEDVRIEGDRVLGKPVINLSHPSGQKVVDDIENGFLNAASIGDIVPLDFHYEPSPTGGDDILVVDRWYNKETSLVDKPGNRNAFKLCDENGNAINLSDIKNFKTSNMLKNTIEITPGLVALLNLKDGADGSAVISAIRDLTDKNIELDTKLKRAEAEKAAAEQKVKDLMDKDGAKAIKDLLDKAVTDQKINKAMADKFTVDYAGKPDALKDLLDNMPKYQPIVDNLKDGDQNDEFKGKTWDELHQSGKLKDLKDKDLNRFKELYKQAHNGAEYKG